MKSRTAVIVIEIATSSRCCTCEFGVAPATGRGRDREIKCEYEGVVMASGVGGVSGVSGVSGVNGSEIRLLLICVKICPNSETATGLSVRVETYLFLISDR